MPRKKSHYSLKILRRSSFGLLALFWACSEPAPTDVAGFLEQGDKFLAAEDRDKAIASYRQALHLDSLNSTVLIRLGKVYQLQGKEYPADLYLRRGIDIAYQKALVYFEAGNMEAARQHFTALLEQFDAHPMSLEKLGQIELAEGRPQQALPHFEKAITINPKYTPVLITLGKLYVSLDRPAEARKALEQAIASNINSVEAYIELGKIYKRQENWSAAAKQFETALLIRPKSTEAKIELQKAKKHL